MWINDKDGVLINLSHVARIEVFSVYQEDLNNPPAWRLVAIFPSPLKLSSPILCEGSLSVAKGLLDKIETELGDKLIINPYATF